MSDITADLDSYREACKGLPLTRNGGGAQPLSDGDEEILDRVWDRIASAEPAKKPTKE